jgi:hypothetical protein
VGIGAERARECGSIVSTHFSADTQSSHPSRSTIRVAL